MPIGNAISLFDQQSVEFEYSMSGSFESPPVRQWAPLPAASNSVWRVPPEERREMIACAAWRRAERRGFAPGGELDDWLAAEAEINTWLEGTRFSGD
jgi:hypothetical protein